MSDTRWNIRVNGSDFFKVSNNEYHIPVFIGERGRITQADGTEVPAHTIIGDSIADVMNGIASLESEVP